MSFQQKGKVISLPPAPPRVNNDNNNYICIKYCPKGLDHLKLRILPEWLSGFKRLKTILYSRQRMNNQWIAKRVRIYFDG